MLEEQQPLEDQIVQINVVSSEISATESHQILRTDEFYRRFPILEEPKFKPFWKEINGCKVPTSAVFKTKPNEDGLSVDILALTTSKKSIGDPLTYNLCIFPASTPLDLGNECCHAPVEGNDAHALIVGDTNKIAKKLQNSVSSIIS